MLVDAVLYCTHTLYSYSVLILCAHTLYSYSLLYAYSIMHSYYIGVGDGGSASSSSGVESNGGAVTAATVTGGDARLCEKKPSEVISPATSS
jgi:hypothetical protein